jgi:hypothetical protein
MSTKRLLRFFHSLLYGPRSIEVWYVPPPFAHTRHVPPACVLTRPIHLMEPRGSLVPVGPSFLLHYLNRRTELRWIVSTAEEVARTPCLSAMPDQLSVQLGGGLPVPYVPPDERPYLCAPTSRHLRNAIAYRAPQDRSALSALTY